MDDDAAYLVLHTRDARFDGRLFVGVSSTGIYCRPVCRVRVPKRINCHFFASAAQAEEAGFRPCLRCRPELAPGWSTTDASATLANQAARCIDQAMSDGGAITMAALARHMGVSDRHLRRIFQDVHGVTPLAYTTTRRLLLAKQLLTDTALPVTTIALQSGYGSVRRFNAAFAERYRLTPSAVRATGARSGPRRAGQQPDAVDALILRLAYRPPYDVDGVLAFFTRRQVPGLEEVDGYRIRRWLRVVPTATSHMRDGLKDSSNPSSQNHEGWVEMHFLPDRHEVELQVSPALAGAVGTVLPLIRQGLDLDADPALMAPVLASLPGPSRPGLRMPGAFEGFEAAVRVILGQQVTVAAARTLTERLVNALGDPINTPWPGVRRCFPSAQRLAEADPAEIGQLGIVRQRVGAIQALSRAVCAGLPLHRNAPLQSTLDTLLALPGIGDWSAQLIAMRCLAWPDAFPASDIGVLKALGHRDPALARQQAEAWRPWRAYAVMQLWMTLE